MTQPKKDRRKTDRRVTGRAASISRSWTNPKVAAARAQRNGVLVKGCKYRSVRAAFEELGLPLEKHIAFRGLLKAAGRATFDGLRFKLLES